MTKKITNEQMDAQNWRYKKQTPPVDEFADLNGPVITKPLPHPLKCSKCDYIATSIKDSKMHWLDH